MTLCSFAQKPAASAAVCAYNVILIVRMSGFRVTNDNPIDIKTCLKIYVMTFYKTQLPLKQFSRAISLKPADAAAPGAAAVDHS